MKSPSSLPEHIRELEERLLRPDVRRSRKALDEVLCDEFVEFASDGAAYDRVRVIDAMEREPVYQRSIAEFRLAVLAVDVVHATYRIAKRGDNSAQPTLSLRSSIWKSRNDRWQLIFHQGTLCAGP